MSKPLWSFVLIARNEAKTLPRLMASLREFTERGGKTVIVDTGSTDGTPEVARSLGCVVYEEGNRFMLQITPEKCREINSRFIVAGDSDVMPAGGTQLFNFGAARNYAASKSPTDHVAMPDCDEIWTRLNIDEVNRAISDGVERFEYNFVFSHDQYGNEATKFLHSKFYDRRKVTWVGIVHEVLTGDCRTQFFDESVMKLEHFQNPETNRGGYLTGLAVDCFEHPEKDRNSHYFARELMYTGRYRSAIVEFDRHVAMNKWLPERAQSLIHTGDCYSYLGDRDRAIERYFKAHVVDGSRREPLLKLAHLFHREGDNQRAAAFTAAALTVPYNNFYCNVITDYRDEPHWLMYLSLWWIGDREGAYQHWKKAIDFSPLNPRYINDGKFFHAYSDVGIQGWMRYEECAWLHDTAKMMSSVAEIGSWKGRSTHAILSGCTTGTVTAIDHFKGTTNEGAVHAEAHDNDSVYKEFCKNTQQFGNLEILRTSSLEAAALMEDGQFDMVFLDGDHSYEAVKADIKAWRSKARLLLCGHDYCAEWPGVKQAVNEEVGLVSLCKTIWYKWLVNPLVTIVIPTLGRPEKLERTLQMIQQNAGYTNYEVIVKPDRWPPHNKGVPLLVKEAVAESKGELVMFIGNDCLPEKNFLLYAVLDMARWFPNLDGMVGLNDGYWKGEVATHWLASKKLLPYLDGEFFHTGYFHAGCDNELTERCRKLGKYGWSERSIIGHDHPVNSGAGQEQFDEVHRIAYNDRRLHHDRTLLDQRAQMYGFRHRKAAFVPVVPRQIFTIWLSEDGKMPDLIKKCVKTHKLPGFQHRLITLRNCFRGSAYVAECINKKQWARAADYLRAHYLYTEGGIYFDADMEVLKDVDDCLPFPLTCEREDNGFIANSFIAAKPGHELLKQYLDALDATPVGTACEETWHSGMGAWTVLLHSAAESKRPDVNILEIGSMRGTLLHHFAKSWTPDPALNQQR